MSDRKEYESPAYLVSTPSTIPNLVFGGDEYRQAYEWATGERICDNGTHPDESNISIIDFDGTFKPPITNV